MSYRTAHRTSATIRQNRACRSTPPVPPPPLQHKHALGMDGRRRDTDAPGCAAGASAVANRSQPAVGSTGQTAYRPSCTVNLAAPPSPCDPDANAQMFVIVYPLVHLVRYGLLSRIRTIPLGGVTGTTGAAGGGVTGVGTLLNSGRSSPAGNIGVTGWGGFRLNVVAPNSDASPQG